MSRATTAYVSAYDLSRVHQSSLYRFATRRLNANFNGCLPTDDEIQCVTWRIDCPEIAVISDPQITEDGRETSVTFAAQLGGFATVQCEVSTVAGSKYNQVFSVNVREASWFGDEPPLQIGPYSVSICVEPEEEFEE